MWTFSLPQNCIETQYWIPSRYSPGGYGKRKIQYWLQLFKIYLYSCEKQMAWHLFRPLVVRMSVVSRSYVTPYLRFRHNVQCKQLLVSLIIQIKISRLNECSEFHSEAKVNPFVISVNNDKKENCCNISYFSCTAYGFLFLFYFC